MRCRKCKEGIMEEEVLDDLTHIIIFCEHKKFVVPVRVVDGIDIYLDELPDDWQPDMCPLGEVE